MTSLRASSRTPHHRRWTGRLAFLAPALGLLVVTGWNLTRSDHLEPARRAYAKGDLAVGLQRSLDHLRRRPWSDDAALIAARCLSRLDFAEAAEPYFQKAGPLSLEDLQLRAFGLVRGNHRRLAIEAYEQILARWPDNVTALRRLAAVQLSENNVPQLNGLADRLIQSPRGAAIGYTLRGVVAHNDFNYEGAVAAFERVLELDPELRVMPLPKPLFWSQLADDLIKLGRFGAAVEHLTTFLAGARDAPLMNTLGRAHVLAGSFPEAERCFRQAAEWEPGSYLPWLNLGKLELQRRRFAEALEGLENARLLVPRQTEVLHALAAVYRILDRPRDVASVERSLKEDGRRPSPGAPRKDPWPSYAL
jgi:tetratricopeptide (TPR) repeat protein